jgi:hypothetical protein
MATNAMSKMAEMEHSTEEAARTAQDSVHIMMDYAVRAQDLNMKLAQKVVEAWIQGMRQQSKLSQNMMEELFEKTEEQTDALEKLFGPWDSMYMGVPLAFVKQGLRIMEKATTNGGSR